jgi:hypothetical protein
MYTYSSQYEVFLPLAGSYRGEGTRQRSSLGDGVSLLWGVFDWMEWEGLGEVRFLHVSGWRCLGCFVFGGGLSCIHVGRKLPT